MTDNNKPKTLIWKDPTGKDWSTRLTIADVRRLKENSGIDLFEIEAFEKSFANALDQVEILTELARPQWEAAGLNAGDFENLLLDACGGFGSVVDCFLAAVSDFYQRLGQRGVARVMEKSAEAAQAKQALMLAKANSPKIDRLLQKQIEKADKLAELELDKLLDDDRPTLGNGSTSVQES